MSFSLILRILLNINPMSRALYTYGIYYKLCRYLNFLPYLHKEALKKNISKRLTYKMYESAVITL